MNGSWTFARKMTLVFGILVVLSAVIVVMAAGSLNRVIVTNDEVLSTNVENLISQGAKVVVILAQDGTAIIPSVQAAAAAGIPVIAYDRLIEDPSVLYITFDNVRVGEMQAEAVLSQVSEGNFIIIKGNSADANADFLRQGYVNAGIPPVDGTDQRTEVKRLLAQRGIHIHADDGRVRAAVHWYNRLDHVERYLTALGELDRLGVLRG